MVATVDDNDEIVALAPDREHPISKGFACHKGLNFLQVHKDPDRVNFPLRRTNPKTVLPAEFERVQWDDALSEIGEKLRALRDRHGPDSISVYFGNPVSLNSNAFPLAASLGRQIGSRRNFNAGTQDTANKPAAVEAVLGTLNLFPIPDFERTDYLLLFGGNPKISHWTYTSLHRPMDVLKGIIERGGSVRFFNPRRIESVSSATGTHTPIRPDTDVYLMAALLFELDRIGLWDKDVLASHGKRLEELRQFVSNFPPDRVSNVTGISVEEIRKIAREYGSANRASVYMATGVNQGRQGTLAYWLLLMLSFVTGNLGRPGGDYYAKGIYPNARPIVPVEPDTVETGEGPINIVAGSLPGYALGALAADEVDPIRALIVLSGNPLLSLPGEEAMRSAFPNLELIVHVDLYRNATGEYADFILPAADWLERPECNLSASGMQPKPFVQSVDAVVEPQHERKDDWWIISRLQQELGIPSALDQDQPDMLARSRKIVSKLGLTLEEIRSNLAQSAVLPVPDPSEFFDTVVGHPDGKVDCCPAQFGPALARCLEIFSELEAEDKEQVKLISLRTNYMHNSNLANMPILKRGKHANNPLHINPEDATSYGLEEGDEVRLSNQFGSIETEVTLDDTLMPGVVAMSHGYGHARAFGLSLASAVPGANVNALMPSGFGSYEVLSNMAHLNGINVVIEPK